MRIDHFAIGLVIALMVGFVSGESIAAGANSWADALGANGKNVGGMELIYWDHPSAVTDAAEVLEWFSQLPLHNRAFGGGKVLIAPAVGDGKDAGVYWVLQKMSAGQQVAQGFKETEGTAKRAAEWYPPFNKKPFVIITHESLARYNAGLVHELLHHYYWALPNEIPSRIQPMHDAFLRVSGDSFTWRGDPGHIFVFGCQYFPLGYGNVIDKYIPGISELCEIVLGKSRLSGRGTTMHEVDAWASYFVNKNGMKAD
jgi:hypothetical protein